jgi:hypothetical protein
MGDRAARGPLTASAVMRYLDDLERDAEGWYRALAARYPDQTVAFERCAAICAKNRVQVLRTYQETVTDALETGYAFEGLDLSAFEGVPTQPPSTLVDALTWSNSLEERAAACYEDVAARSARLLATIPRALQRAAEGRRRNAAALRALAGA